MNAVYYCFWTEKVYMPFVVLTKEEAEAWKAEVPGYRHWSQLPVVKIEITNTQIKEDNEKRT